MKICEFVEDCPTLKTLKSASKKPEGTIGSVYYDYARNAMESIKIKFCNPPALFQNPKYDGRPENCPTYHFLKSQQRE